MNRLKKLRKEKNMTQEQVAKHLNCDRSMVSYYEKGHSIPTVEKAILLTQIFDCSLDYFFGLSDKRK